MRLPLLVVLTSLLGAACAPPLWEGQLALRSSEDGHVALACDRSRAVLVQPRGYTLVTEGPSGLVTQATVTGAPRELVAGQGLARLVGDRLLVASGGLLNIFDVSKAPELVMGSVPLDVRAPFDVTGHTLYVGTERDGIRIYDVADVRAPRQVTSLTAAGDQPYFLSVYRSVLYVVPVSRKTIVALSLADPQNPVPLQNGTSLDFGLASTTYQVGNFLPVGDHLVATATNSGRFSEMQPFSVDVSDPANLVLSQGLVPSTKVCTMVPLAWDGDRTVLGIPAGDTSEQIHAYGNPAYSSLLGLDVTRPEAPVATCTGPTIEGIAPGATVDVCVLGKLVLTLGPGRVLTGGQSPGVWLNVASR